ncbi:hypothetical protein DL771_004680 [Monosporascus sp. 5C6A]|nr:hypothetical protein DL771_004680 [Monosporascus sp. 5C6A]
MVRATYAAAAAAATTAPSSSSRQPGRERPGREQGRTGSFRAGSPLPTLCSTRKPIRRISTAHRYHTFPTPPPKTPGRRQSSGSASESPGSHDGDEHGATPLPVNQLALLALLSLSEQSALNSISPYLPEMIGSFPDVAPDKVGLYVGLLASAFALAQLATNLFWGYWHIVLVHVAMGLLNGNAAVVPTCLGELTDRSNQSRAFTWLPVVYSLGSITGPALGGLLVGKLAKDKFPYLAPNILGASLLALSVVVLSIWFEETLEREEGGDGPDWTQKMRWLSHCLGRAEKGLKHSLSWRRGRYIDRAADESDDDRYDAREERGLVDPSRDDEGASDAKLPSDPATWRQILNRTTIVLLTTSLVFQLSNSSFNSLYPVFASAQPPTGRDLRADVIGVSLSVAGIVTILFQLFLFRSLKSRVGNVGTYRGSLFGFGVTMALMPLVGYRDSKPPFGVGDSKLWLYAELGFILIIKNICAVGGLSSVMLLITNSAPSHASLGTLNGIAQTLSAAGRSVGPFISGGLFTVSTHVQPKGEALAWGIFAGVALAGWLGTYAIHGEGLESTDDGFEDEGEHENEDGDQQQSVDHQSAQSLPG